MLYIDNKFRSASITEDILIIKPRHIEISTIITVLKLFSLVSIFILTSTYSYIVWYYTNFPKKY